MATKPDLGSLVPRNIGVKVGILLGFTIVLAVGFVGYVLYARGVFENFHRLTLVADNAEGVSAGMDLTFAGFPIGRVRRISLDDDGKARIHIRVPVSETRWLRETTVFTLEVPLIGTARIRAYTANLQDAPLPDGAVRNVLRGDTADEIPRMVASVRAVLDNIDQMTNSGSSLQESLRHARTVSERMAGKYGVLGGVLGSDENARTMIALLARSNALLESLAALARRADGVVAKTDERLYGKDGLADEARKAAVQANAMLGEVRERLKAVDAILADVQAASASARSATANVAAATTDLGALRAEVESSLRKVDSLINELNRKWPFARDTTLHLP